MLDLFLTSFYYGGDGPLSALARRVAPGPFARRQRVLRRRHDPEIPRGRVRSAWSFDLALALERRLAGRRPRARRRVARWRTRHSTAAWRGPWPGTAPRRRSIFSDVGSEFALPACRKLGIAVVLSMVHGDVREERLVLEREAESAPDFFPIYLGDGAARPRRAGLAARPPAPRHRAGRPHPRPLGAHRPDARRATGPRARRSPSSPTRPTRGGSVPSPGKRHDASCTFLFAGGITQRKGIKYLLEAWRRIRRPGWRLQLLGPLPSRIGPLAAYLDEVEPLGRVSHAEVPARMAAADVFVFPSLFEGSAVVTYEALACGLPSIVTPDAGSVVRDGVEGFVVPPRDVEALAGRMERLGLDPDLRAEMAARARVRALEFDWPRYHAALIEALGAAL